MDLDPALCRQAMLARDARFDGRFFTGVTSTGIYCRPVCPARPPSPANCLFFPTASAAQGAGFRPCLRCRPETAPGQGAWRGTSATVARALAMIDDGALAGATTGALAARLGIGQRQLRRLFDRHVGAPPIVVAQTRRVLLAKQLIHETGLSMIAVADASGFGSVRRFNEAFQTLFGRAPASLRHGRATAAPDAAITLSLGYRPPYDWASLLGFLSAHAIPAVERVSDDAYARVIGLAGEIGTVMVTNEPAQCRLRATICFPSTARLPIIIARLRRMFDLEADPTVIAACLSRDSQLRPLVAARPGLRVPGAWDGFELGVRAILGRQMSADAATRLVGRLVERFGTMLPAGRGAGLTHAFPGPSVLARAALAGLPPVRVRAIASLASACCATPTLFERAADLDVAVERLRRQPGIDAWTAQSIAMRAMREPDAFPAGDVGVLRAMDEGHGRPTERALQARAEAWRPWRAYAAMHLWTTPAGVALSVKPEIDHAFAA